MKARRLLPVQTVGRETWLVASTLLVVSSGIAQLAVNGVGRIVLGVLSVASLTFLCVRALQIHGMQKLASISQEAQRYRRFLRRLADHPTSSYEEEIDITYQIGMNHVGDVVTENRTTLPRSELLWRNIGLTVSDDLSEVARLENVGAAWSCDSSGGIEIEPIPIEEGRWRLRALVLFQPPIQDRLNWRVRYRPEGGLWNSLRTMGRDSLRYTTVSYFNRKHDVTISSLTIRFVFPPDIAEAFVREDGIAASCRRMSLRDASGSPG
jgi:hypothetical protein